MEISKNNKIILKKLKEKGLLCKCGCDRLINITRLHLYRKIPGYITGHSSRNKEIKEKRLKIINEKFKTGELVVWNKGLTQKTDERVKNNCERLHSVVRNKYANGSLEPWNKGLNYKNHNYPKDRKNPILSKEQRKFKKDSFVGSNNPNFNPNKSEFQKYKIECKFGFDMGKYPKEFKLKYIKNMFHPIKNKEGYTRDHIFSIFEGFKQNIEPNLINHPANCELMLHRENSRKNKWIDINKDDLLSNIKIWECKYGVY